MLTNPDVNISATYQVTLPSASTNFERDVQQLSSFTSLGHIFITSAIFFFPHDELYFCLQFHFGSMQLVIEGHLSVK